MAASAYRQTGLGAQQCALLDVAPRLRRDNASGDDYPMDAARWGFEGWVRIEYDIGADGKTLGQRAIIAYPPFVFRDAAVRMAKTWYMSSATGGTVARGARQPTKISGSARVAGPDATGSGRADTLYRYQRTAIHHALYMDALVEQMLGNAVHLQPELATIFALQRETIALGDKPSNLTTTWTITDFLHFRGSL